MPIHRPAGSRLRRGCRRRPCRRGGHRHLLARCGLRVLLVDRGRFGTDTLSTHALMRGGVLQLSRWGLLDKIVAAGTPAGAPRDVPLRRCRRAGHHQAGQRRGRPVRAAANRARPDPGQRRRRRGRRRPVRHRRGRPRPRPPRCRHRRRRPDPTARRSAPGPGSSSAPTASVPRSPHGPARRSSASGPRRRRHLRLLDRPADRRLRVELPPRRRRRCHPDQRRPGMRVRQRVAASASAGAVSRRSSRSSRSPLPTSPSGSRPRRRRAHCARSAGGPATCADRGDQAGRSSATRATSRIRSAPTG